MVSMHGDDFTCSGARPQLQRLETEMSAKYELTVGARLGLGKDDDQDGFVLNRLLRFGRAKDPSSKPIPDKPKS